MSYGYLRLDDLEDLMIHFHDIARMIERELGPSDLTVDIRNCADRLKELVKERND